MTVKLYSPFIDNHILTFLELNDSPFTVSKKDIEQIDYFVQRFNEPHKIVEKNAAMLSKLEKNTKILALDIFHNIENQVEHNSQWLEKNNGIIITNAYDPNISHKSIIFVDFLFNIIKAYFSQYPFSIQSHIWHHKGEFGYIAPTLTDAQNKRKIFVAPNKTYENKDFRSIKYRPRIVELLQQHEDRGYIGNLHSTPRRILYPHYQYPFISNIDELTKESSDVDDKKIFLAPVHNAYYSDTFLSVYGETIEYGNSIVVTEKTYTALIKGHFILPFSNYGFLARLKSCGFVLPQFINYEYDSIKDADTRFVAYIDELNRLLSLDLDTWKQHWNDNLHLLLHNQRIFHNRPYDRIDLSKLKT